MSDVDSILGSEDAQGSRMSFREIIETHKSDRLGLPPLLRISALSFTSFISGGFAGSFMGYKDAGYKYLVHNSHRLPKTKLGWFQYHRAKGYACIVGSMRTGFKTGVKLGFFIGMLFSIEAGLDHMRGRIDFGNTMLATCISGFLYASTHNMRKIQAVDFVKKGGRLGIALGLSQDLLQYVRGADVWYLDGLFGIQPIALDQRLT